MDPIKCRAHLPVDKHTEWEKDQFGAAVHQMQITTTDQLSSCWAVFCCCPWSSGSSNLSTKCCHFVDRTDCPSIVLLLSAVRYSIWLAQRTDFVWFRQPSSGEILQQVYCGMRCSKWLPAAVMSSTTTDHHFGRWRAPRRSPKAAVNWHWDIQQALAVMHCQNVVPSKGRLVWAELPPRVYLKTAPA